MPSDDATIVQIEKLLGSLGSWLVREKRLLQVLDIDRLARVLGAKPIHHGTHFGDWLAKDVGADNVLQIFEHTLRIVLFRIHWRHHGDRLNLALQNEKALLVEIDAVLAQLCADVGLTRAPSVHFVDGRIVALADSSQLEMRPGNLHVAAVGIKLRVRECELNLSGAESGRERYFVSFSFHNLFSIFSIFFIENIISIHYPKFRETNF